MGPSSKRAGCARRLLPTATAAAVAVAGCGGGGGGGPQPSVPVPAACESGWNEATETLVFGRHAYSDHDARQAQVLEVEPGRGAPNIKSAQTCAVIFSAEPTDPEFGDIGLAKTKFGWASMIELDRNDPERLAQLQQAASEQPNATVFPDGTIEAN